MGWKLYRWTWRLLSPLHIGTIQSGFLKRTRLYVPGYTVWGAVTASVARALATKEFPDYKRIGEKLRTDMRFGYMYPAVRAGRSIVAWLPKYEEGSGLVWIREDGRGNPINDRSFRRRILHAVASTSIEASSDTAEDESLHETEVILQYMRPQPRSQESDTLESLQTHMVGHVLVKEESMKDNCVPYVLETLDSLVIGGDSKYGFGRVELVEKPKQVSSMFGIPLAEESDRGDPVFGLDPSTPLPAHTYASSLKDLELRGGSLELLQMWGAGTVKPDLENKDCPSGDNETVSSTFQCLTFVPGSKTEISLRLVLDKIMLFSGYK